MRSGLGEIVIYHLQRQPLEAVLPRLLDLSRSRGWRALVRVGSEDRVAALDDHLWTYSDESFLPHGTSAEPDAATQPVLLTSGDLNPNGAQILFLADSVPVPDDISPFERVAVLLDGHDEEAVAAARIAWRAAQGAGHAVSYWRQDDDGRWQKRG